MNKLGISGLNKRTSPKNNSDLLIKTLDNTKNTLITARVVSTLLNSTDDGFFTLGEWNALGTIRYETIDKRIQTVSGLARPISSNIRKFPLLNELVYIIFAPDDNLENNPYSINAYYIDTINLWNHPHHNGYPEGDILPLSQNKDYTQTSFGNTREITNEPSKIILGKTFKERSNIHPLLPFEGDIIYEGRWSNSIRLGSTVKNTSNNWSSVGVDGDPLIILRNGQGIQTDQGWIPITENINNDNSSIYLTSTQNIPLEASSTSYVSYNKDKAPASPNEYAGSQIILNSGRLIFNSKEDHILLSSAKSINLNSLESVNIDTKDFIIQSNKIYLGSNQAAEPLMLGTKTTDFLKELILTLKNFMTVTSVAATTPCVPGSPAILPTVQISAQQVLSVLNKLEESLIKKDLTSDRNYTIK